MAEQTGAGEINLQAGQPKLAEELKKMEYEPLLPIEKKLIGWSIGLGVGLLFILYWVSATFFPGGH
ncbi:MAG TPA: hypothetical protein VF790_10225 [Dissulfurispiraceae bacterium]